MGEVVSVRDRGWGVSGTRAARRCEWSRWLSPAVQESMAKGVVGEHMQNLLLIACCVGASVIRLSRITLLQMLLLSAYTPLNVDYCNSWMFCPQQLPALG